MTGSTPSAVSESDPAVCRLRVSQVEPQTVVLAMDQTDYALHLATATPLAAEPGRYVTGRIVLPVWKLDRVPAGGAYIEPVIGRPRRVQGRVIAADAQANRLVLQVGRFVMIGQLPDRYAAADVPAGQMVVVEVAPGARFEPA